MKTIGDRIRSARKAAKLTQKTLGEMVGVSSQAVTMWESGENLPSRENLVGLANALDVAEQWLLTGSISTTAVNSSGASLPRNLLSGRSVPLMSMDEAVSKGATGQPKELVMTQFPCSELSFAVTLEDESNAPVYPKGCRLVVDPKRSPSPGKMVLAVDATGSAFVGEYRLETTASGLIALVVPHNSKWPTYRSDMGGVSIIGCVTEYTIRAPHI